MPSNLHEWGYTLFSMGKVLGGYSLGGCLTSIIIGFVDAWLGLWITNTFDLPRIFTITVDGQPFPVVWSIIGSAILALLFGMISRRRVVV